MQIKQIRMLDKEEIYYRRRLSFLKFKRSEKTPNIYRYSWADTFNLILEIASLELFIMHPEIPKLIKKIWPN